MILAFIFWNGFFRLRVRAGIVEQERLPEKALVFHVEGNTFPNQEGIDTKRFISINGDEFRWTTPNPSVGGKSEAVWKRLN